MLSIFLCGMPKVCLRRTLLVQSGFAGDCALQWHWTVAVQMHGNWPQMATKTYATYCLHRLCGADGTQLAPPQPPTPAGRSSRTAGRAITHATGTLIAQTTTDSVQGGIMMQLAVPGQVQLTHMAVHMVPSTIMMQGGRGCHRCCHCHHHHQQQPSRTWACQVTWPQPQMVQMGLPWAVCQGPTPGGTPAPPVA